MGGNGGDECVVMGYTGWVVTVTGPRGGRGANDAGGMPLRSVGDGCMGDGGGTPLLPDAFAVGGHWRGCMFG